MTTNLPTVRQLTQAAARRRPARNSSRVNLAPRIAILPYGGSDGATALKNGIVEAGPVCTKLRVPQSAFRGRPGDLIVNWGNSTIDANQLTSVVGQGRIYNRPDSVRNASDKIQSFRAMDEHLVPTVEWTTNPTMAQRWVNEGCLVYARTRLSGHSGEGIVMVHRDPITIEGVGEAFNVQRELPTARLYTKGITAQRREFRVHVMGGVVINVQQKKRADGYRDNPSYSNVVRNYHTGWIYANGDISPNTAALDAAVAAVRACGLDFGAVDVITRRDQAWVLEVNTAPGMQGSNLDTYVDSIVKVFLNQPLDAWIAPVQPEEPNERAPDPVVPRERAEAERPTATPRVTPTDAGNGGSSSDQSVERRNAPAPTHATVQHNSFYRAEVRGVPTVVQYNVEVDGFYMPGWEIPMNQGDQGFTVYLDQEIVL